METGLAVKAGRLRASRTAEKNIDAKGSGEVGRDLGALPSGETMGMCVCVCHQCVFFRKGTLVESDVQLFMKYQKSLHELQ